MRGVPSDYNSWSKAGNVGWSYNEVFPYFLKLENDYDFDNEWHNQHGEISIRRYKEDELTLPQRAFLEGCKQRGYTFVDDHNRLGAIGIGLIPMNLRNGIRESTAITYLTKARNRNNFCLLANASADHILWSGKKAVGVQVIDSDGKTFCIYAERIIISAGTYASPAILMRSGIGDTATMKKLEIQSVCHLPGVGKHLQDHPIVSFPFVIKNSFTNSSIPNFQTLLTLKSSAENVSFDLMIFPVTTLLVDKEKSYTGALASLIVSLTKPMSTGWVKIPSSAASAPPLIQPDYFSHAQDMPRMIECVQYMLDIAQSDPIKEVYLEPIGFRINQFSNYEEIKKYILNNVSTLQRPRRRKRSSIHSLKFD